MPWRLGDRFGERSPTRASEIPSGIDRPDQIETIDEAEGDKGSRTIAAATAPPEVHQPSRADE